MTETDILRRTMLEVGRRPDVRVFRNNVGVAVYPDGSRVVYGLAPGSSDLVGWRIVTVTPDMVGQPLAQFLALEVKTATGRLTTPQKSFLDAVRSAGGIAAVVRSPDDAVAAVSSAAVLA